MNSQDIGKTQAKIPPPRLGDLLIKAGYVKKEDVDEALAIQSREKEIQNWPIGQILIENEALSESGVKQVLDHPDLRKSLGEYLIEQDFLSRKELDLCLKKQPSNELLGQFLISEGYLNEKDLEVCLKEQINAPRFGKLALALGLINSKDLEKALRIQTSPRKLGEILCDMNLINPLDLNHLLNKNNKQLGIEEILISRGIITQEQLLHARQEHSFSTETLGEILLKEKIITREDHLSVLSEQNNIEFEELSDFTYSEQDKIDLTKIISQKFAEKKLIIPISLLGNRLKLALFKPEEVQSTAYELKGMYSNYDISCILITEEKYEELFEVLYSTHLNSNLSSDGIGIPDQEAEIDFMELNIDEEIGKKGGKGSSYGTRDIEAEELVNFILTYGIINSASDIHIEQDRKGAKLRYRIDGILREPPVGWLKEKLKDKTSAIISRIKVMSNLDISEKRLPQDGSFRINYVDKAKGDKYDLDFRVATCRATVGENATIRILDPRKALIGLDNLNHSSNILTQFKTFLKSPSGMILVCGPTGSGKSSTLYAALQFIHNPGIKIITAEDPIEYNFPGIMQTQVNPKIDLTFSKSLRSFLRFDPDVILVGEIRDEETAKISFDAAQTGHLMLSTLHTNDAISSVHRLLDLGVEYGQITSSLMCVLAQRLIRRICSGCKEDFIPEKDDWSLLFKNYPTHLKFYNGRGCEACNYSGYKGRTLISEIFSLNNQISKALTKGYDENQITRIAMESGMKTMIDDGLIKLNDTTLSEIIRVVPYEMIRSFRNNLAFQGEVDNLVDSLISSDNRDMQASDKTLEGSFRITNPEAENATIDLILSRYEKLLKTQNGGKDANPDSGLFKEFIKDSYNKIHYETQCKSVEFNLKANHQNGKVDIFATPNL